ncbi:MAG: alkylation response protein AidB-like acyl-CoA dehydrogenase [Candidatus Azotimanducaceae bacterium]|jgi:alkylation response protein AidB-like acyl-CoA dehydrogenase
MTKYQAPLKEMDFVLNTVANIGKVYELDKFQECNTELVSSILDEANKFASGVLAPLNSVGDLIGTKIVENQVRETSGFSEAYQKFIKNGWTSLPCDTEYGGMGLPKTVGIAAMEMWSSANVSFALCPLLGHGAIEALQSHASEDLRKRYLEKMISGEWTGTMNLTEPQAGSDLGVIKTSALPNVDHYLIKGTKIFITWGDHQMTDNIVHLVLARIKDAPAGVRGISLFIVPKFLTDDDGVRGTQNDVYAISVEHKMGIHGSPTCVMSYGENGNGAIGYLVGEENMGLSYMFTMMNHARLNVGVQGVALSESAYQQAVSYAKDRVQGNVPEQVEASPIINHPDVKRMLMLMRSLTEGSRALCYLTAVNFDLGHTSDKAALDRAELLTPIAKAWSTEVSQEVTSLGVQVHGGMGYIEETGAAQFMRDARITTIYEGTTGIQANDFIGRKVSRNQGKELKRLIDEMRKSLALGNEENEHRAYLQELSSALYISIDQLENTMQWILSNDSPTSTSTAAFNFLMGAGTCIVAWLFLKSASAAAKKFDEDPHFYKAKMTTSRFYTAHVLPRAGAYFEAAKKGSDKDLMLDEALF